MFGCILLQPLQEAVRQPLRDSLSQTKQVGEHIASRHAIYADVQIGLQIVAD
jgi:hypothetical protein